MSKRRNKLRRDAKKCSPEQFNIPLKKYGNTPMSKEQWFKAFLNQDIPRYYHIITELVNRNILVPAYIEGRGAHLWGHSGRFINQTLCDEIMSAARDYKAAQKREYRRRAGIFINNVVGTTSRALAKFSDEELVEELKTRNTYIIIKKRGK